MLSVENTDGNTEGKAASIYRDCRVRGRGSRTPKLPSQCRPPPSPKRGRAIRSLGRLTTYMEGTRADLPHAHHSSSSTQPQPRSSLAKAPHRLQSQSQGQEPSQKKLKHRVLAHFEGAGLSLAASLAALRWQCCLQIPKHSTWGLGCLQRRKDSPTPPSSPPFLGHQ